MKLIAYNDVYKEEVIDLILHIQQKEFQVAINRSDQPDLQDIPKYYSQFWLAIDVKEGVIGTLGVIKFNESQAVLKRMFLNRSYRGKAVAQKLLEVLVEYCRAEGINEIYLGTLDKFRAAQRFYEKNGFEFIKEEDLPNQMPRMEVDTLFYRKNIKDF